MIGRLGHICPPRTVAEYIVVAGGGGGGQLNGGDGGFGGAGGVLDGAVSLLRGQAVTVTVGTGGIAAVPSENGTDSVLGNLTAVGGGFGGAGGAIGVNGGSGGNGGNGGSGGGGGNGVDGGTHGTPGSGITGQGDNAVGNRGGGRALYSQITGLPYFYGQSVIEIPRDNYGDGGRAGFAITGDGIVVSGAGTAAANGTYEPDGTVNGKTRYRLGSTTYYIVWIGTDVGNWVVSDDSGGSNTLYTGSSDPASPIGGTTVNAGDSPAPTISSETGSSMATAGASGVVIIAYPDTLPALTVGAGLTYDEPTRAGYRVYRFTSGTGTITP
jgi:hypothetical protein